MREALQLAKALFGGERELEQQRQHRGARDTALGAIAAMTDGRERRLDRVRGPQVHPVLGRKVIEGEQRGTVLLQALGRLRVLRLKGRKKTVEGELSLTTRRRHPDLVQHA